MFGKSEVVIKLENNFIMKGWILNGSWGTRVSFWIEINFFLENNMFAYRLHKSALKWVRMINFVKITSIKIVHQPTGKIKRMTLREFFITTFWFEEHDFNKVWHSTVGVLKIINQMWICMISFPCYMLLVIYIKLPVSLVPGQSTKDLPQKLKILLETLTFKWKKTPLGMRWILFPDKSNSCKPSWPRKLSSVMVVILFLAKSVHRTKKIGFVKPIQNNMCDNQTNLSF